MILMQAQVSRTTELTGTTNMLNLTPATFLDYNSQDIFVKRKIIHVCLDYLLLSPKKILTIV